jgi:hypothetical protein
VDSLQAFDISVTSSIRRFSIYKVQFKTAILRTDAGGDTMKSKSLIPVLLLLGISAIFGYSGCSAIGFGIGGAIDSHKPDYDTIPGWRAASIQWGKHIALTEKNGEEVKGEYLGLDTVAVSEYAQWYNQSREKYNKDVLLPMLGDTISFTFLKPPTEYEGEFLGFDNQYILVKLTEIKRMVNERIDMGDLEWITDKNGNVIEVRKLKSLSSQGKTPTVSSVMMNEQIDMNNLETITDKNGNVIEVRKLESLSLEGKIPSASTVKVRTGGDTIRVPTATVSHIEIPSDKNAKWVGLGIGSVVDMAIVVAVVISMSNTSSLLGGNWDVK